jgi:hypothetical protein
MNLQEIKTLIKQQGQFYTYILKRPNGQPFYVGKGNCKGFRIENHTKEALRNKGQNRLKINIIRKIWEEGNQIDYEIVLFSDLEEMAFDKEMELISFYGRVDKHTGILANMTDGGEGLIGAIHSEEQNKKNSEWHKGKPVWNKDRKGLQVSWNKGKKVSEKTRLKMSQSQKGRVCSEETKQKLSESCKGKNKGRIHSKQVRQHMSDGHKGQIAWNKGIPCSEEVKNKLSKMRKGILHTIETKKKISESQKGKVFSDEHKEKISKGRKGWNPSVKTRERMSKAKIGKIGNKRGKFLSEETKKKISDKLKGNFVSSSTRKKLSDAAILFWSQEEREKRRRRSYPCLVSA